MKTVARRVSGGRMPGLIKAWLEMPVEEEDGKGGKRRTNRARREQKKPPRGLRCTRDGGRFSGAAAQAEVSTHPLLLSSRDMVVSELGKAGHETFQMRITELNH